VTGVQTCALPIFEGDDKAWAFVDEGKLPLNFKDIDGEEVAPVPLRYHKQVDNFYGNQK